VSNFLTWFDFLKVATTTLTHIVAPLLQQIFISIFVAIFLCIVSF